jgi:hypothetical protein
MRPTDTTVSLAGRQSAGRQTEVATAPAATTPSGFHWSDAGVGAGLMTALAALAAAAALILHRRRMPPGLRS